MSDKQTELIIRLVVASLICAGKTVDEIADILKLNKDLVERAKEVIVFEASNPLAPIVGAKLDTCGTL